MVAEWVDHDESSDGPVFVEATAFWFRLFSGHNLVSISSDDYSPRLLSPHRSICLS